MFKKLALAVVILVIAIPTFAQDSYKTEIYGGYNLTRINPGGGVSGDNFHGFGAGATLNVSQHIGLTGDFSAGYKDVSGAKLRVYNALFGPTFSMNTNDSKVKPFVHALFGVSHASASFTGVGGSDNAFAMALGGGADVAVHKNVAIRLIQADYLMTRYGSETQNNIRLGAGIVFRF